MHHGEIVDILAPSGCMKTISNVLESSWAALSIRRKMGLIEGLLRDRIGQKRG